MRYVVKDWPRDEKFPFRVIDTKKVLSVGIARTRDVAQADADTRNAKVR